MTGFVIERPAADAERPIAGHSELTLSVRDGRKAANAVSVACLTLFDMLKAVDRTMVIEGLRLTAKTGGKSGSWDATD